MPTILSIKESNWDLSDKSSRYSDPLLTNRAVFFDHAMDPMSVIAIEKVASSGKRKLNPKSNPIPVPAGAGNSSNDDYDRGNQTRILHQNYQRMN